MNDVFQNFYCTSVDYKFKTEVKKLLFYICNLK